MNIMIKGNLLSSPLKDATYVFMVCRTYLNIEQITLFLAFIHCQIYFGYILLTSTYIHSHSLYLYMILIQSYELVGSCEKTTNKIKC